MDMRFLMKQAQAMQAKLAEAQANLRAEGTAGGGTVKVVLNGSRELQSIRIAKEAMDPEDPSMLEDLIQAAFNDAATKVDEGMKQAQGGMGLPGMNLPGLKGL
ncbi:MAG: YbaB/EbfC family nucleoid-associated protein [Acidobacteria bacterium]|nr:YbaB/EbfC family nucleoid-associated protein [Acidobacteriota bacterium]